MALETPKERSLKFLDLPSEIHSAIVNHLSFPDKSNLRRTSHYFHNSIPPATHAELLAAEQLRFSETGDFYACKDCLRLRTNFKFADNMRKGKRGRFGVESDMRFCIDCGIHPKPGTTRYPRGSYLIVMGEAFVLCTVCVRFKPAASDKAEKRTCQDCWGRRQSFQRGLEQLERERREREQRARARVEREAYHRRMEDTWGSIYEPSSDGDVRSEMSSERYFNMVQAEANLYMNSPGPGSD
jgi:hypothetical protein